MANAEIVPFGKYKGQPVDVLAQDRDYCEWLVEQDWFRTRYATIHTLIINNFGAPTETPEHNALQALFLDGEWVKAFVVAAIGGADEVARRFQEHIEHRVAELRREIERLRNDNHGLSGYIYEFRRRHDRPNVYGGSKPEDIEVEVTWVTGNIEKLQCLQWQSQLRIEELSFECGGNDVVFTVNVWAGLGPNARRYSRPPCYVECKPSLGDDYPAVLRQMKANDSNVLLLGEGGYNGIGATFDQVKQIFSMSGIEIVDVENVDVSCIEPKEVEK